MKTPYTKSGRCGDTVWQWNGHAQISYPYYVPFDPRTAAQVTLRQRFGAISPLWASLTEAQRAAWRAPAQSQKTRRRLGQSWPLHGFLFFMRVNLHQANHGLAPVVFPPAQPPPARDAATRQRERPEPEGALFSCTFPCLGMAEAGAEERNSLWSLTCCPGSPVWYDPEKIAARSPWLPDTS